VARNELRHGRKVALKLLPADFTRDRVRFQRFEHEAGAASALNHPNVCTIYALDQISEGQHFIPPESADPCAYSANDAAVERRGEIVEHTVVSR
jgi:hypothetical protein